MFAGTTASAANPGPCVRPGHRSNGGRALQTILVVADRLDRSLGNSLGHRRGNDRRPDFHRRGSRGCEQFHLHHSGVHARVSACCGYGSSRRSRVHNRSNARLPMRAFRTALSGRLSTRLPLALARPGAQLRRMARLLLPRRLLRIGLLLGVRLLLAGLLLLRGRPPLGCRGNLRSHHQGRGRRGREFRFPVADTGVRTRVSRATGSTVRPAAITPRNYGPLFHRSFLFAGDAAPPGSTVARCTRRRITQSGESARNRFAKRGRGCQLQPSRPDNKLLIWISKNGRGDRIRTCDLLLPKQALYQAELRPARPLSTHPLDGKTGQILQRLFERRIGKSPQCRDR
jgi:hypothetical protein